MSKNILNTISQPYKIVFELPHNTIQDMEINEALDILCIPQSTFSSLTSDSLKKIYHKMALKNHPDKCHNDAAFDATQRFQQIQCAYTCLAEILKDTENDCSSFSSFAPFSFDSNRNEKGVKEDNQGTFGSFDYIGILNSFIKTVIKESPSGHPLFLSIIKEIVTSCKRVGEDLFSAVDKDTALDIYAFLTKHQTTLGIDQRIVDRVQEILLKKYERTHLVIVKPTFKEMFESDVYKLIHGGETYYVPLWHSELQYESTFNPGYDVIVKCVPRFIPDNVEIDEHNNVHIAIDVTLSSIDVKKGVIPFHIDGVPFSIDCRELRIVPTQIHMMKKKGIPVIDDCDMYNDANKSDIIVAVRLL